MHTRLSPVTALAILVVVSGCHSDLTKPTPPQLIPGAPVAWGGGSSSTGWEVGLDESEPHTGKAAAYIRSLSDASTGFASLAQNVRADNYRGQRVRWSGWVRQTNVRGAGGGLWMRVDGPGTTEAFDNMLNRPLVGTGEWQHVSVVLDVPVDALGLGVGALLAGPGDLLVDDLSLEVVGQDVPSTDQYGTPHPVSQDSATMAANYARTGFAPANLDFEGVAGPPQSAVDWLSGQVVAFATAVPGSDDSDLEALKQMVGTARVLGVGEGTHGTREFFQMKDRVFRFLVRQMGFTTFAIEATSPESDDVNRYVLDGVGDPAKLLSHLYFWTWNTQEVQDLIDWMREWNLTAPPERRVRFVGFDMQFPGAAMDRVLAALAVLDADARTYAADRFQCIAPYSNVGVNFQKQRTDYAALPEATRTACRDSLQEVYDLLRGRRTQYVAAGSDSAYEVLLHHARLVQQFEQMASVANDAGAANRARDAFMAENTLWILEHAAAGTRMMLWAHNYHISRLPGAMGDSVARALGADYVNVGQIFGTGSFNAVGSGSPLQAWHTSLVPTGSLEAIFSSLGKPRLIFDARSIDAGGPVAAPLHGPIPMRSIGAMFDPSIEASYFAPRELPQDFDILTYFQSSSPTQLLQFVY